MTDETKAPAKINFRQRVFIDEYLRCFHITKSAIAAKYSEKTAYSIGSELLKKPEIIAEIERRLAERQMNASEALDVITSHGRSDMGDYLETSRLGFSLNLEDAKARGLTRQIKKLKQKTTIFQGKTEEEGREVHEIEIELYDAQAAADKILRVAGKYKDKVAITDNDGNALTINVKYGD